MAAPWRGHELEVNVEMVQVPGSADGFEEEETSCRYLEGAQEEFEIDQ